MIGAFIEKGPANFQVLKTGTHFKLAGRGEGGRVFARLRKEDSGDPLPWQEGVMAGEKFSVCFQNVPPGLYTVETCLREGDEDLELARQGDKRFHVGIGEVFVIAGQSNAVGFGREPYGDPPRLGIHILRNNGAWDLAAHPLGDSTGAFPPNRDNKNPGHSPYLAFAKCVQDVLGCPIGLVQTAQGGSSMERWNPSEEGALYRNMITAARRCGPVTGVLWYQGCAEAMAGRTEDYGARFMEMVRAARRDLASPGLPFFTCGLNHYDQDMGKNDESWRRMRAIQQELAEKEEGIYFVPTLGLPTSDGIHNSVSANKVIGGLLARCYLKTIEKA